MPDGDARVSAGVCSDAPLLGNIRSRRLKLISLPMDNISSLENTQYQHYPGI